MSELETTFSPRARLWLRLLGAFYLAYLIAGLFLVPPLVREPLAQTLSDITGREVRIGEMSFNPLGLSVEFRDLLLMDRGGEEMIGLPRLYADFELSSLLRWSLYFDEIELEQPRVLLERSAEGFNLAALGPRQEDTAPPEENGPAGVPPVSFGELSLLEGRFRYRDLTRESPLEMTLAPVSLTLEDFTTGEADEEDNSFRVAVTAPDGGTLDWSGHFRLQPFSSSGQLAVRELSLGPLSSLIPPVLDLQAPEGRLEINTDYRLSTGENGNLTLSSGQLQLSDLTLRAPGSEEPDLRLQVLAVEGVALDADGRRLTVDRLSLSEPAVRVRLTPDGNTVAGFSLPGDEKDGGAEDSPAPEDASAPAWQLDLASFSLEGGTLHLHDGTGPEPAVLAVTPVNLSVQDFSLGGERKFRLQGELGLADAEGRLALSGEGRLSPLAAAMDMQTEGLALAPLQPWLDRYARLTLSGGQLTSGLSVTVSDGGDALVTRVTGGAGLDALSLAQPGGENALIIGRLALEGLELDTGVRRLNLDRVEVQAMDATAVVDARGRGVGQQVMAAAGRGGDTDDAADSGPAWQFRLGEMQLSESRLGFRDRSVSPEFSLDLEEMSGVMRDLDSSKGTAGELRLDAKIDRYAPLAVNGSIDARPDNNLLNLDVKLSGYEMTRLTPYTMRFLGYKVQSGQLAVDSDMKLRGTVLDSRNRLLADNFYLGEAVQSDQAVSAPLKLGLAVLRNRSGLVELPVNITGDLADPSVNVRGLILKSVGNVLVKAATSPFSVLAGLVGTSETLDHIPFPAGSAEESDATLKRLEALAGALARRPHLNLRLTGVAGKPEDRVELAMESIGRRLATEAGLEWTGLSGALPEEDFRAEVREELRLRTGVRMDTADSTQAAPWPRTREALRELARAGAGDITSEQLQALAADRARTAKAILVKARGVDAGRLFLQTPLVETETDPGVRLSLESP